MTKEHQHSHFGENPGVNIADGLGPIANRFLSRFRGQNSFLHLGEHGEVHIDDARFGRSPEPGMINVYIRKAEKTAAEHKVITATIAAGIVIGGIAALRHGKKS